MSELAGQTALVTGASRGIGLAIAQMLHREGVRLTLLSRTPPPPPLNDFHQSCDLADLAELEQILGKLPAPDILIHNAGIFHERPIGETNLADWERVQRVNVTAPFLITRAFLPAMTTRQSGRILFIASTASVQAYRHQAAYVASKHALLGFARTVAVECRPFGVHVHVLCPGGVATDLIKGTELGARLAGQPLIQPSDIAEWVRFLLLQPERLDVAEVVIRRFSP
ncbi:MAG: SDR family oxidoreductase [Verrucomicrobiae bacterium]|nr:SDR family oxidoreductase [Verrucomicrobiae bacterium]